MMRLSTCALLLAVSSALHAATTLPGAGMSMQTVESQFGKPLKKNAPVGQPPITRWEYDGFVVVFERSTVVGSVNISYAMKAAPATPAAAPAKTPATAPTETPAVVPAEAPATTPVEAPVATPAPASAPAAASEPASAAAPATTEPAAAPEPASATTPAAAGETAPAQDPMSKAAAEKAAEGTAPAPAEPPGDGYVFDPETGRIIIK